MFGLLCPNCSLINSKQTIAASIKKSNGIQSCFSYLMNLLLTVLPVGTTTHRGESVIFLHILPIDCCPGVSQMTQKASFIILLCYTPLNLISETEVVCVGFISGASKSHHLICTLNLSIGIFYTMNKRMPFAKSITYFYCMLFHPLLSHHFIHMDFFQKINLSIRISLWAAALVLWGVYQNFKTNSVLLILVNSTKA